MSPPQQPAQTPLLVTFGPVTPAQTPILITVGVNPGGDAGASISASVANAPTDLSPGDYSATTPILVPSNSNLTANARVSISSAPGNSGDGHTNSPVVGVSNSVQIGTLSADVTEGDTAFTYTPSMGSPIPVVGNYVSLNLNGDVALTFRVKAIAGNVITTDVPIPFNFPHASPAPTGVILVSPTSNVHVNFGGATLTQINGARGFWFPYAFDSEIQNLIAYCSGSVFGPDLDIGGRRSVLRKIHAIYVANVGDAGLAIEGGMSMLMEECSSEGAFPSGIQIGGYRNEVRGCSSDGAVNNGLTLCPQGPMDLWGSQRGVVTSGRYDNATIGVLITGNSSDNVIMGVDASYNTNAGFSVYAGVIAVVGGPQRNTFHACTSYGGAYGWIIGDEISGAIDTTLNACDATGGSQAGIKVNADALRTMINGFRSVRNVFGLCALGDVTVSGFVSVNDGTGVRSFNSANVSITEARIEQNRSNGSTWAAVYVDNTSSLTLSDSLIVMNGTGGGAQEGVVVAGTARLTNVRVSTSASGTYGIVGGGGGSFVYIGPGCDFGACTTPILPQSATVVWEQGSGATPISSTHTLTFIEHYNGDIELAAGASADATVTTYGLPGLRFTARNLSSHNLTVKTSTSGDSGITIAAGK